MICPLTKRRIFCLFLGGVILQAFFTSKIALQKGGIRDRMSFWRKHQAEIMEINNFIWNAANWTEWDEMLLSPEEAAAERRRLFLHSLSVHSLCQEQSSGDPQNTTEPSKNNHVSSQHYSKTVLVRGFSRFDMDRLSLLERSDCAWTDCLFTDNVTFHDSVAKFDAVLFDIPGVSGGKTRDLSEAFDLPEKHHRNWNQRFVLMTSEAPPPTGQDFIYPRSNPLARKFPYERYNDYFNWTLSYRDDSDIFFPYGFFQLKGTSWYCGTNTLILKEDETHCSSRETATDPIAVRQWRPFGWDSFARTVGQRPLEYLRQATRKGSVAWIVSHCYTRSQRETYAVELRKHFKVKIYGSCGFSCGRKKKASTRAKYGSTEEEESCDITVVAKYKFYLSFENALCDQYVTEKFFKWIAYPILPVVRAKANWSRIAPPHSFVNVDDFGSPKELAEYLAYLDSNPAAYLSYFWWKDHYIVRRPLFTHPMCALCQRLHDKSLPRKTVDLKRWLWDQAHCQE